MARQGRNNTKGEHVYDVLINSKLLPDPQANQILWSVRKHLVLENIY